MNTLTTRQTFSITAIMSLLLSIIMIGSGAAIANPPAETYPTANDSPPEQKSSCMGVLENVTPYRTKITKDTFESSNFSLNPVWDRNDDTRGYFGPYSYQYGDATFDISIPNEAKAGDKYWVKINSPLRLSGAGEWSSNPVLSADGEVIANVSLGTAGGTHMIFTYTDYVESHDDIEFSYTTAEVAGVIEAMKEQRQIAFDCHKRTDNANSIMDVDLPAGRVPVSKSATSWYGSKTNPSGQFSILMRGDPGEHVKLVYTAGDGMKFNCDGNASSFNRWTGAGLGHFFTDPEGQNPTEPLKVRDLADSGEQGELPEGELFAECTDKKLTVAYQIPEEAEGLSFGKAYMMASGQLVYDGTPIEDMPVDPVDNKIYTPFTGEHYRNGKLVFTSNTKSKPKEAGGTGTGSTIEEVVPLEPTLEEDVPCGREAEVIIPEVEGIKYTTERRGDIVIVTATAEKGYKIAEGEGISTHWDFKIPEVVSCEVTVTPVAPQFNTGVNCDEEAEVVLPDTEGVTYKKSREGNIVTVTAIAKDGYVFAEGIQDQWSFEIPDVIKCAFAAPPSLQPAKDVACGEAPKVIIPESEGVVYSQSKTGNVVHVSATAEDGYELTSRSEWDFYIPEKLICESPLTPVAPMVDRDVPCGEKPKLLLPYMEGVSYFEDWSDDGSHVGVIAIADPGYTLDHRATATWNFDNMDKIEPCLIDVAPVKPTLNTDVECDQRAELIIPDVENIHYNWELNERGEYVVEAEALGHYQISDRVTSRWIIPTPAIEKCPVPIKVKPIEPIFHEAPDCDEEAWVELPEVEGVIYSQTRDGDVVTVVAVAEEGYVFDADAVTSWIYHLPAIEPCPLPVTPLEPVLSDPECDNQAEVVLPSVEGVEYSMVEADGVVTVTAEAVEGYIFTEDAVSEWTFTIPEVVACLVPVTPEEPTLSEPECDNQVEVVLPDIEGVEYSTVEVEGVVTVTATASEGYVLAEDAAIEWTLTIPQVVPCEVEPTEDPSEEPTETPSEEPDTGKTDVDTGKGAVTGFGHGESDLTLVLFGTGLLILGGLGGTVLRRKTKMM